MKLRLNVCIGALILAGLVWAVQGYGELSSTAAKRRPEWLWIGIGCMAVGGVMATMLNWPGGDAA